MIIILKQNPAPKQLESLKEWIKKMGLDIHESVGKHSTILGLVGDTSVVDIDLISAMEIVENVKRIQEIMDLSQLHLFDEVDVIQVGARNMQNFLMLKELGKIRKPILLKRGFSNTIQELLMSAEYILSGGNKNVILCERGIRTIETATRNTLDLSAIPVIKECSHLPVVVDPSHATGHAKYVKSMSLAAVAAGADGLMIEVHNNPHAALCDGQQSITPEAFNRLAKGVEIIREGMVKEQNL